MVSVAYLCIPTSHLQDLVASCSQSCSSLSEKVGGDPFWNSLKDIVLFPFWPGESLARELLAVAVLFERDSGDLAISSCNLQPNSVGLIVINNSIFNKKPHNAFL